MEFQDTKADITKTFKLYDSLNLYSTSESYYLQPIENESVLLYIDRLDQEMSIQTNNGQIPSAASMLTVFGVLGRIQLIAGHYLLIVTGRKRVGQVSGHDIWRVEEVDLIPLFKTTLHLSQKQEEMNKIYGSMLKNILSTPYFYFSYSFDITHSLQRLNETAPDFLTIPMYKRADPRFIWNAYLLEQFYVIPDLHKFCVPVIHGFVSINPYTFEYGGNKEQKTFVWAIIARRSCHRAGTRLFKRGIDSSGNVANFVETEEIVEYEGARSSYVQIRGSIPLFWQQYPNLKLKPKPALTPVDSHLEACAKHIGQITQLYGNIVIINLIDHKGREAELEKKFNSVIQEIDDGKVRFVSYDFHAECKNMQYHKLSYLIEKLAPEQEQFSYFLIDRNNRTISQQNGVFRTNCIDCLDRTNVVQSMIAWKNFSTILKRFELLSESKSVKNEGAFYRLFQNVWADHADHISTQYSGTGALKTDYTRTGRRTYLGVLKDGCNTLLRYYKNNLKDGNRQDSIDLLLGNYQVKKEECVSEICPLQVSQSWKSIMFEMILLIAVAMFFANTVFPSEYSTTTFLSIIFWGAMVFATISAIIYYGLEFVDFPKLLPLDVKPGNFYEKYQI